MAINILVQDYKSSLDSWVRAASESYTLSSDRKNKLDGFRLIDPKGASRFEFGFFKDHPGSGRFVHRGKIPAHYQFQFAYFRTGGIDCEIRDYVGEPFELRLLINGEESVHPSTHAGWSIVKQKVSSKDDVSFYFDGVTNHCGSAYLIIQEAGDVPVWYLILASVFWILFVVGCLFLKKPVPAVLAITLLMIISDSEGRMGGYITPQSFLGIAIVPLVFTLLISFLTNLKSKAGLWIRLLLIPVFILITFLVASLPIIAIGYEKTFDKPMVENDWYAVFQTHTTQATEFLSVFAEPKLLVGVAIILLFLFILANTNRVALFRSHWILSIFAVATLLPGLYLAMEQLKSVQVFRMSLANHQADLRYLQKSMEERALKIARPDTELKKEKDETVVLVIGESVSKYHVSLYGYPRDTTPLLNARRGSGDFIVMENAYASGISSRGAMLYAMTNAHAGSGVSFRGSPSVIEVLNDAGLDTIWVENGRTRVANTPVEVITEQSGTVNRLSDALGREDGKLVEALKGILSQKSAASKVVFLRTQGSHVAYCHRIDHDREKWRFEDTEFDQWLVPGKYPLTGISENSNCYDGSIKYTDYVVNELIKLLEDELDPAVLIYFSDHGDDIIRGTAHMGLPTFDVFSVPMLFYFSPGYMEKYPDRVETIRANRHAMFVNDQIFETVLGVAGVISSASVKSKNLAADGYNGNHLVNGGSKSVLDDDSYEYRTKLKIEELLGSDFQDRIMYSMGKLRHPFHFSYINYGAGYPHISFDLYQHDGEIYLSSLSKRDILFNRAAGYINLENVTDLFINFTNRDNRSDESVADGLAEAINALDCFGSCQLTVSVESLSLAMALEKRNIRSSVIIADEKELSELGEFSRVTIPEKSLDRFSEFSEQHEISVTDTACEFHACNLAKLESRLRQQFPQFRAVRVVSGIHEL